MSITVDQLEVQIKSDSTSAVGSIDALASSLNRLKSATKGGVGLRTVASQVSSLNTALSSVDSSGVSRLDSLANALQKLSTLGKISLNKSLSTNITSLGVAVSSLKGVDFTAVNGMSQAMQSLSSIQKSSGLASLSKNITAFGTAVSSLDVKSLTTQINQLNSALTPLASNLSTVATAMKTFNQNAKTTATVATQVNAATSTMGTGYMNLWAKLNLAITGLRSASRGIASLVSSANDYIEDVNLFNVAMGNYASEAGAYAEKVSSVMGIDPGEWIRNQSVFQTIIEGFGNSSDAAYKMSKNLTQLGYDMSSFFNISYEDAFQKLQSGISGELEPLRRLGYDLSVARLQQEAYSMGITKSVSSMTQAEKSMLRYHAIMTQVTTAQGDMARTLSAPSNQLRVLRSEITMCARAWGQLFIPILSAVLPYAIAVARVLRTIAGILASLFDIKLPSFSSDIGSVGVSLGDAADGAAGTADGLGDAAKNAKKMKDYLLGIDELNVISPDTGSSGSGGSGSGGSGGGGGVGDLDIPEYDFLNGVSDQIQDLVDKMLKWLGLDDVKSWFDFWDSRLGQILEYAMAIGAALAAWKIAKGLRNFMDWISGLKGFSAPFFGVGLLGMLSDILEFKKYLDEFLKYGPTFRNVTGMISEFAGMLGDAFLMLGNLKIGGVLKIIQGIGEIVIGVKGWIDNGPNWDDALTVVRGISNIMIGIGAITGNPILAGAGIMIQGVVGILRQIQDVINAVKTGDWSGVDKISLAISALEVLGGLFIVIKGIVAAKNISDAAKSASEVGQSLSDVTEGTTTISTATETLTGSSSTMHQKLKELAGTLAWGIVIIAEVAAAAILVVGAILILGIELQAVAEAWTPVIANGQTVVTALVAGAAIMATVGVVIAALGTAGSGLAVQMGIGILMLAELSVATDLFLAEIWAIGELLNQIYEAWSPVLANGESIATAIGVGTGLLIGIGVVTAALGVATVATAGLLPVAIGLGTALLVELAAATVLFIDSLTEVANELNDRLAPALSELNGNLPELTDNMSDFVDFMTSFAGEVVRYTEVSAIAGLAATINTIIGWFTEDPIDKLASDVSDIYIQTVTLNDKLNLAVPELETAIGLLKSYQSFLSQLESLTNTNVELSTGMFVNMEEVGQKLVTGFVSGIKSKSSDFSGAAKTLVDGFKSTLTAQANLCQTSVATWGKNLKTWFTSSSYGGANAEVWRQLAYAIVTSFNTALSTNALTTRTSVNTWSSNIKNWFTEKGSGAICADTWRTYAQNIVSGFKTGLSTNYTTSRASLTTWSSSVKEWFYKPNGVTLYSEFEEMGKNVIRGFIEGSSNSELWDKAKKKIRQFGSEIIEAGKEGLDEHSPSKAFWQIGAFAIQGWNNGAIAYMTQTYAIMDDWLKNICSYQPSVSAGFSVDTSAFDFVDSEEFFGVSGSVTHSAQVAVDGYKEGMGEFYDEYMKPLMSQMAEDMRRQADKKEQTIVKIGNRTVSDAVVTQKNANGYRFVTEG